MILREIIGRRREILAIQVVINKKLQVDIAKYKLTADSNFQLEYSVLIKALRNIFSQGIFHQVIEITQSGEYYFARLKLIKVINREAYYERNLEQ